MYFCESTPADTTNPARKNSPEPGKRQEQQIV